MPPCDRMCGPSGQDIVDHERNGSGLRGHRDGIRLRSERQAQPELRAPRHRPAIDTDDRLRSRQVRDQRHAGHAVVAAVIVFLRIAARLSRTLAVSSGLDPSIIRTGFFGVVGTDITRSRTSEVSFRSFDAGRMLDQSRWHRHCPGFRVRRGTVGGSGWSAGAFGWSLRPMLREGVALSGPIRGQTRPRPVPCARAISGAFSGGLQDDAAEYAEGGGPRRGGRRCAEAWVEVLCSARLRTP